MITSIMITNFAIEQKHFPLCIFPFYFHVFILGACLYTTLLVSIPPRKIFAVLADPFAVKDVSPLITYSAGQWGGKNIIT
jgi:hypothetical protein